MTGLYVNKDLGRQCLVSIANIKHQFFYSSIENCGLNQNTEYRKGAISLYGCYMKTWTDMTQLRTYWQNTHVVLPLISVLSKQRDTQTGLKWLFRGDKTERPVVGWSVYKFKETSIYISHLKAGLFMTSYLFLWKFFFDYLLSTFTVTYP